MEAFDTHLANARFFTTKNQIENQYAFVAFYLVPLDDRNRMKNAKI